MKTKITRPFMAYSFLSRTIIMMIISMVVSFLQFIPLWSQAYADDGSIFVNSTRAWQITPDSKYYLYRKANDDFDIMYRKWINEEGDGIPFLLHTKSDPFTNNVFEWNITPDSRWYIYTNKNDWGKKYIKWIEEAGEGIKLIDANSWWQVTPDSRWYIYNNGNDGGKIYKKLISNNAPPTNLSQKIQSPYMEIQEISLWGKVWKYQSGPWIIFSVDSDPSEATKLVVAIYKIWDEMPKIFFNKTSSSATKSMTIPYSYLWAGYYFWKARLETDDWRASDWVDFRYNPGEADYSLFEWFEPYPYGYKFHNRSLDYKILGWWTDYHIDTIFPFYHSDIIPGNKWDIFRNAFDISSLQNNEKKMIDAFEALWLNETGALSHWGCYGMAVSSAMQYTHSDFINTYYPSFSNAIWAWTIWDNINPLSTDWPYWYSKWNSYSKTLETILSFQLSQHSIHVQKAISSGTKNPMDIVNTLQSNPNKTYALLFWWKDKDHKDVWHTVIPYKVVDEWSIKKIFIWDNNVPFPDVENIYSYNQYIEIYSNWSWKAPLYKTWTSFTKMSLVSLDDIYNNWKKSAPSWLNGNDIFLTLSWNSDMYISDSLWRVSWFTSSGVIEEIPGVEVIVPVNATLDWVTEDNLKQIYLPQKIDWLTIKVSWNTDEAYDLKMAWWDYYTKISWVSTNSWQTDSYNLSREQLQINFDDSKTWNYSLMIDDFQNDWTGSIYRWDLKSTTNLQKYSINWQGVIANNEESIKYEIDSNNDWIYDLESYYSSLPTSPDEKWSISWYVKWDTNASMAGWKVCIDINKNGTCEESKEPFQVTDNKWYYEFKNLDSKEYSIIEIPHQNWKITKPITWKYPVYLNNWQKIKNVNFENTFTKWKSK
ncbi:MAG: hypothetical protein ACD_71C00126G0002 [uncultured bacterium (gcode 4)]|uniref:Uncharacterized protein n=1 Tax=uncultured bacterium (gcode 4) TaxID=1234023 RepID=K1Z4I6_9BACT|nr:MAG: hypothetical protein ACD_71C00126G0002 [uncultured bacterium (gcode 4)]